MHLTMSTYMDSMNSLVHLASAPNDKPQHIHIKPPLRHDYHDTLVQNSHFITRSRGPLLLSLQQTSLGRLHALRGWRQYYNRRWCKIIRNRIVQSTR
jgi:hypothetical protein